MNEHEIKQVIFGVLRNIAPDTEPEKLQPGDNIRQTLDIDSFDYLRFIVALDEKLGISTPEQDYGKIKTLQLLTEYIQSHSK